MSTNLRNAAQRLIPGAYDRTTLTYRQAGAMSGPAFGSPDQPSGAGSMDAATIAEHELEGGGGRSERRRTVTRGAALANEQRDESRSTGGHWWLQLMRLARR